MTSPSLLEAARRFFGCKGPEGFVCRDNSHSKECWRNTAEQDKQLWACESLAAWASALVAEERERCIAECERIREAERNVGEDCPSGGWGGYKLGARDCASAIRNLRHPPAGGEGA